MLIIGLGHLLGFLQCFQIVFAIKRIQLGLQVIAQFAQRFGGGVMLARQLMHRAHTGIEFGEPSRIGAQLVRITSQTMQRFGHIGIRGLQQLNVFRQRRIQLSHLRKASAHGA